MKKNTLASQSRLISLTLGLLAYLTSSCAIADVIAGTGSPSATTLGERTATQLVGAPAGVGHALILPYYNSQNGNVTVFSITNTDRSNGKAVKVRVRGAGNGDSLLSLTVLMGPGDVWNASLSRGTNGLAELSTFDSTCTVPHLAPGAAQPMSTSRLNYPAWTDADKANQTREGYVEVIAMADIPQGSPGSPLLHAISRNAYPGATCGESEIYARVTYTNQTNESLAAAQGLAAPTTGLAGKWLIINVPETTTFSGSMYALRAVNANGEDARANFVLFPQTASPYSGAVNDVTADPLLRGVAYSSKTANGAVADATASPVIAAALHDLPDLSTPYVVSPGPDAALAQAARLSDSMAVKKIQNENTTEPSLTAKTDWVLSVPARRYSIAMDYAAATSPRRLFSLVPAAGNQYFHESALSPRFGNPTQHCWSFGGDFYDRDTGWYIPVAGVRLEEEMLFMCGSVAVLSFQDRGTSAIGGSVSRRNYIAASINGWGSILSIDPTTSLGLPVIGSAFIKFSNPSASPGISGNYGVTFEHWLTR